MVIIYALKSLSVPYLNENRCISESKQNQYPEIPWRRMVGMRNRLSHAYFEVDLEIVWQVVSKDLPDILPIIETAISELEKET